MRAKDLLPLVGAFAEKSGRIVSMAALSAAVAKPVAPLAIRPRKRAAGPTQPHKAAFRNLDAGMDGHYVREDCTRFDPVPMWAIGGFRRNMRRIARDASERPSWTRGFEAGAQWGYLGGYVVPQRASDNASGL